MFFCQVVCRGEAVTTGATAIAVGCPFCLTMRTDAARQADQDVEVRDLVELVAEGIAGQA